jgi:hypothetical protein
MLFYRESVDPDYSMEIQRKSGESSCVNSYGVHAHFLPNSYREALAESEHLGALRMHARIAKEPSEGTVRPDSLKRDFRLVSWLALGKSDRVTDIAAPTRRLFSSIEPCRGLL